MTQPTRFSRIPTKKVLWEEQEVLPHSAHVKKAVKDHVVIPLNRAVSLNALPLIY